MYFSVIRNNALFCKCAIEFVLTVTVLSFRVISCPFSLFQEIIQFCNKRAKRARSHLWRIKWPNKPQHFELKSQNYFFNFRKTFIKLPVTLRLLITEFLEISRKLHLTAMMTSIIVEVTLMLSQKIPIKIYTFSDQ